MIDTWLKSSEGQLAVLGALMTAALLLSSNAWWSDVLASFRAHLGLAVLLGAALAAARRKWPVLVANLALFAFLIMPLSMGRTPRTSGIPDLVLAVHNVHSRNTSHAAVLTALEDNGPDVMAFLEVDENWAEAIRRRFPNRELILHPRSDNFGIALVSRVPMTGEGIWYPEPLESPSIDVTLSTPNGPVRLLVTHPVPPLSEAWWEARNTQLQHVLDRAAGAEVPVVVAGDFNLSPTSPTWGRTVGRSRLRRAGMPIGTWPSWLGFLGLPIDHVLTSPGLGVVYARTLPGSGSDHRGQVVGLRHIATVRENP